jgi:hypothetical protein
VAQDSVLEIVRDFCSRTGLGQPNTATGSTDSQVQQIVGLLNEEGQELADRYDWESLVREKTFVSAASEGQGKIVGHILSEADGFSKILNDTINNRTTQFPVTGPLTPRVWQAYKSSGIVGSPYSQYRIRGGTLMLHPAPPAEQLLAFEWKTENWVSNENEDAFRNRFIADSDFPLLNSRLLLLGLRWRWKKEKGLEYAEDFNSYESAVLDAMTRDKTATTLSLDGRESRGLEPTITVARGSWPL